MGFWPDSDGDEGSFGDGFASLKAIHDVISSSVLLVDLVMVATLAGSDDSGLLRGSTQLDHVGLDREMELMDREE